MAEDAREAAWALKQACYAAWHTAPPQARAAADALRTLAAASSDPELRDLTAWTEGIAALSEGRLPEALEALRVAAGGFAARGDAQHAAEAQVPQLAALAMLGRDAEALACAEQALAQFLASGDQRSAGKVVHNLGSMLTRLDRHAEAAERFRQAAVHFARCGDAELSIAADLAFANTLTWQFRFDEALLIFERGRARAAQRGLAILHAHAHEGIGRIELNRGRWHRALQALAESGRLLAEAGAPPQRRLEAEAALADAYLALNLLDEAVVLYDRIVADADGREMPADRAWALLQRARAQGRLGRAEAALDGLAQAEGLYRQVGNRPSLGLVALARARLELGLGQAGEALASARTAVGALADSGILGWALEARAAEAAALAAGGDAAGAQRGFEAVLEQGAALSPVAQACHTGLGALALAAGDRAAARVHLEQALDSIDRERAALPGDEFRRGLGASAEAAHAHLVRLARAGTDSMQLLADLERGRARALALGLGGGAAPDAGRSARLQWLREQWRQAAAAGDTDRIGGLGHQVQALEHELLEAWRREQARGGVSAAAPAVALAALPAALGPRRALVAYHLQDGELIACVATDEGVQHHRGPAGDLAEQVRGLHFQIDALRHGAPLQRHHEQLLARARSRLQRLHALVWVPLQPLLRGRSEVVVVPHRELHYLPFAALHDGDRWLVESLRLSLASSASVWLGLQQRPPACYDQALVLGVAGVGLPHVAQEAAAVAAAFGPSARVFAEAAATQAVLLQHAGAADVLHLACHARFRADNPAFSSLQLGDGPLTLHDLHPLRLRASLVTLSACETGLSQVAPGDELLGLVRAFKLAGAAAVLATLWPVDDAASADLAGRFYAALRAGQGPAAALQQAQAALARSGAHPWLWAAYTLHGVG